MARRDLTDNEKAANGPLPGDHGVVESEHRGAAGMASPGYYPSLSGAEISGSDRSGCFPHATFGGSFTEPNRVLAWRSEDDYEGGVTFLCTREPGELFLCGGNLPKAKPPVAPGPYIARVDATTGKQIWRTYLENANASGNWIGVNNLNILADGTIVTAWSNQIALLDGDSGRILRTGDLPSGEAPPGDSHFKHLTVAPDGALILKNQTRAAGITDQGTMAMIKGIRKGMALPPSLFVALDGQTLEVLDTVQLPELAATPHGITELDGRIAIYTCATESAYRCFWDPGSRKLSLDETWTVSFLEEGQSTGDAPGIMGDWIVIQTNGIGAKVPSSVVAINQRDPSRMAKVVPFGPLKRLQMSLAPPKTCIDLENEMLYSADAGVGQVAGIFLDQVSGEMTVQFVVDDTTFTFQPLIGPKDERVLVLSNMKGDLPAMNAVLDMVSGKYKEQVTWREAATGRILAESDFFEPLTFNSLIVPGYGSRMYYPTETGFLVLQVRSAG